MNNPSDEIKSRLDIVEVIREYLQLKPAGINFRASCPFHREKTPSFMISPEKQIWHCFGCGKGGDIFSFVMEMEGLSFVEALRLLAPKAGVALKRADPALTSKRNKLLDIVELSKKYFYKILSEDPQAEMARRYLKDRGLNEETINQWQIGYSPDSWDNLVKFLLNKGFGENEIFLAGMSVKSERKPGFYDRFRDRIMFPINDVNGNTVGFSARVNPAREEEEKMGKYINSPQTMIYDKSRILFGLDKAKQDIKKEEAAVVVEGQMDVITAHQNGFTNVVASSGTALTAEQVSLLKRYSNNLILAFDMDKAGDLASERGIAQAMQAEMNIKVVKMLQGKDPDELIKESPDEWRRAVADAKPMMLYYFDKTFADRDLEKLEEKNRVVSILLPVIAKLGSKIEQGYWLKKLSQTAEIAEDVLREAFVKIEDKLFQKDFSRKEDGKTEAKEKKSEQTREERLSELLLALILKHPVHLEYVIGRVGPDELDEDSRTIYRNLIIYYNKSIDLQDSEGGNKDLEINYQNFRDWLMQNEPSLASREAGESNQPYRSGCLNALNRLVLLADKDFYDYSQEQAKNEIINITTVLRKNYLSKRLKEITKLLAQLEKGGEVADGQNREEALKALLEEFRVLTEEIK